KASLSPGLTWGRIEEGGGRTVPDGLLLESEQMAGAVEEGGKVATSIIDALKQEPISLALVLMNVALLLMFFYVAQRSAQTRASEVGVIYENQKHPSELLAHCVDPGTLREILDQFRGHVENENEIPLPQPRPPGADQAPKPEGG